MVHMILLGPLLVNDQWILCIVSEPIVDSAQDM
jgi:hypothetical protein